MNKLTVVSETTQNHNREYTIARRDADRQRWADRQQDRRDRADSMGHKRGHGTKWEWK